MLTLEQWAESIAIFSKNRTSIDDDTSTSYITINDDVDNRGPFIMGPWFPYDDDPDAKKLKRLGWRLDWFKPGDLPRWYLP